MSILAINEFKAFASALKNTLLVEPKYTDLPNNRINAEKNAQLLNHLNKLATAFGIDFDSTGFTFTLAPTKEGRTVAAIYEPQVALNEDGELTVYWGGVTKVLPNPLPSNLSFRDSGTNQVAIVDMVASDADDSLGYIELPIQIEKQKGDESIVINAMVIKKAFKSKALGNLVASKKVFPKKMQDCLRPHETYIVTGYRTYTSNFNGKVSTKYALQIEGITGEVSASGGCVNVLQTNPEITPDAPVYLYTGEFKTKKSEGGDSYIVVDNSLIARKLADAVSEGQVYRVTGYTRYGSYNFKGNLDIKYAVQIEGLVGLVEATGNMLMALSSEPVITPEQPATLYIDKIVTKTNANGSFKVVSNSLMLDESSYNDAYFTLDVI